MESPISYPKIPFEASKPYFDVLRGERESGWYWGPGSRRVGGWYWGAWRWPGSWAHSRGSPSVSGWTPRGSPASPPPLGRFSGAPPATKPTRASPSPRNPWRRQYSSVPPPSTFFLSRLPCDRRYPSPVYCCASGGRLHSGPNNRKRPN